MTKRVLDATEQAIVAENEQLLDTLTGVFRMGAKRDLAAGVLDDDEGALGGVGMTLEVLGIHEMPDHLMVLVCLAVRRIAKLSEAPQSSSGGIKSTNIDFETDDEE